MNEVAEWRNLASAMRVFNGFHSGVWGGGALLAMWLVMFGSNVSRTFPHAQPAHFLPLLCFPVIFLVLQRDPRC